MKLGNKLPFKHGEKGGRVGWALTAVICLVASFLLTTAAVLHAELSLTDERDLGLRFHSKLRDAGMIVNNGKVAGYLEGLGNVIINSTDPHKRFLDFKFTAIKSSAINAFATPGGFVYVNTGLLTLVDNEAELAGVMAHEIAHGMHRHIAALTEQRNRLNVATIIASLAGALLAGDVSGLVAVSGLAAATSETLALQYNREHEEEADRTALEYLTAAGYEPRGLPAFLRTMNKFDAYSSVTPSHLLTHPKTTERLVYLDGIMTSRYGNFCGTTDKTGSLARIQTILVMEMDATENSLQYFERKLKNAPNNPYFSMGLANSYARMEQPQAAQRYYEAALRGAPEDADILRDVGFFNYRIGRIDDAVRYLEQSLKKEDDISARLYLARAFLQKQRFDDVLKLYAHINGTVVSEPEIFDQLAVAYGKTGMEAYSHYFFGAYFEAKGKKDAALFHYGKALALLDEDDALRTIAAEKMDRLSKEIEGAPRRQR